MLRFYYDTKYKYTNRTLIDLTGDSNYRDIDYENIDSPDTINGHIVYKLEAGENIPTYVLEVPTGKRWYVSGITQLRTGKFQISMLRDVLSESELWKDEKAYVEAGTASDYCKYKKWNLPFTNTKVKEERLNINGKSSFYVFYVNQQHVNNDIITEEDLTLKYENIPGISTAQLEYDSLSDIPGYNYIGFKFAYLRETGGKFNLSNFVTEGDNIVAYQTYISGIDKSRFGVDRVLIPTNSNETALKTNRNLSNYWSNHNQEMINALDGAILNYIPQLTTSRLDSSLSLSTINPTTISALERILDKVIRIPDIGSTYKYYKVAKVDDRSGRYGYLVNQNNSASNVIVNALSTGSDPLEKRGQFLSIDTEERIVEYSLIELGRGSNCELQLKADIAKLPHSSVRCLNIVSDDNISDEEISQLLMLCQANSNASGDNIGRIIDIQYLPFSLATGTIPEVKFGNNNATATFVTNDDLIFETDMEDLQDINKETDSIVIVSPSRKSQFQFSPFNNDGNMEFSTRITLRPNQSIIYVRPSTKGLLLRDWDDKDCLIIQEDFSLTSINSDWTNYVYNNRNFQNAFNLEIQTKEYQREWERKIEQAQAKSDEYEARNYEAYKARAESGNAPIISSVSAAIVSMGAMGKWLSEDNEYMKAVQLDRQYNEAMYQNSIDVATTNFNYQVENVRSQPLIPNNITAIDVKMLDGIYLEFYSTNETEKKSIEDFYLHNGNRIENYGTFRNYYGKYIKGKIIVSNNYNQPEINEINRRLEIGIYTEGVIL